MKVNIYKQLLFVLAIGLSISSCSKDETNNNIIDEKTPATGEGSFIYKGEPFTTSVFDAVIYDEYDTDDYTGYDLTFFSTNMYLKKGDNWHYGNGNMVTLSVISPFIEELGTGNYTWDSDNLYTRGEDLVPHLLFYGSVYIFTENVDVDITGGNLNIEKNGDQFDISYWVSLPTGDTISGTYKGAYNHYNGNYW